MRNIPPQIRRRLEPLPFPMRFSDGKIRVATGRMALLRRVWSHIPVAVVESAQALHVYQGGDVLDIGAFHGWYSVLLAPSANAGDRFVSFEPDPSAEPMLQAMLHDLRPHFPSVSFSVITRPVGDGSEVSATWPESTASHPRFAEAASAGSVPSLTVDEFVPAQQLRPRLIKVDVEGAELAVLEGMRETLAEHRPALMLEIHPEWQPEGVTAADVEALVRDAGYDGTTLDDSPVSRRQIWWPRVPAFSAP